MIGVPQVGRAARPLRGTMPHGGSLPAAKFWRHHRRITLLLWAQIAAVVPFGILQGLTVTETLVTVAPCAVLACGVSWIRGRHERHDGLGYPDGLAGTAIPEGAMILALADAWETMTSARPYQARRSVEDALGECRRCAGRQFSPEVVAALEELLGTGALRAIRAEWSLEAATPR